MTRSSEQKKSLRGLFYAATLGSKAAAVQEAPASSADEFEGDTQRGEGPPAAAPVLVGSLALEDQRADSSASGGFADGQGDT